MIKQLSVFMENKSGRLHNLTEVLGKAGVDLIMLTIADTADFGIVRLITKNNELAFRSLKEAGFTVKENELIGVEVTDEPRGLSEILALLKDNNISIEYLYSYARTTKKTAIILFKVGEIEKAAGILNNAGIKVMENIFWK